MWHINVQLPYSKRKFSVTNVDPIAATQELEDWLLDNELHIEFDPDDIMPGEDLWYGYFVMDHGWGGDGRDVVGKATMYWEES